MAKKPTERKWPVTISIFLDQCPRCGQSHGEVEYRAFALGDVEFTHWAYCESTGEPLLINMARRGQKEPDKFHVRFQRTGPPSKEPPTPAYPNGVDVSVGLKNGAAACKASLPYPAKGTGAWKVECTECGARLGCTAAGRADDPKSIMIPCQSKL